MSERCKASEIQKDLNKTYAYFNAVLSSLFSANFLLFIFLIINSLTHTGIDTETDMPAKPDMTIVLLLGFITFTCLLMSVFFSRAWFRRLKALEKKTLSVIVSLIVYIMLLPILGYISLIFIGGLTMII